MRIPAPLTISVVRSIVPGTKRQAQSDGATRGLYLVTAAAPSPLKTWEYRYRSPVTRRQTAVKLGEWPAMAIADARRARDEQAALVAKGLDPAHERRRAAIVASVTLESVARAWDASRAGIVDPHTRQTAMRRLEMYVFPSLGPRPLRSIVPGDIVGVLDPVVKAGQRETGGTGRILTLSPVGN